MIVTSDSVTFDSSAWIEYFSGSKLGKIVKEYVDSSTSIYTPSIGLMEIKNKYQREGKKWKSRLEFIMDRAMVINIDAEVALAGADVRNKDGLHTIDALIYAASLSVDSRIITRDHHFENMKNVIMIG